MGWEERSQSCAWNGRTERSYPSGDISDQKGMRPDTECALSIVRKLSLPLSLVILLPSCLLCLFQGIHQGAREGQVQGDLPKAPGEAAAGGRPSRLYELDHAGRGHGCGRLERRFGPGGHGWQPPAHC